MYQKQESSFFRLPWIEVCLSAWEDVSKSIVFKVDPTSFHAVSKPEIFNERAVLQILFKCVGFVFIEDDEIGVHVLRPFALFAAIVTDVSDIAEDPGNW